ncbi:MAG: cation:proton antiporter, partial [Chloroflexota bacterium]|nr:cation:proton antiporter [Chloroflexota bacterium]
MDHHELILFLLQVAVMLAAALGTGQIMRRLQQPAVVGELIGGIFLGPTVFGALAPTLHARLFPGTDSLAIAMEAIIQLGMLFFLFSAGLEVDLSQLRGRGRSTVLTSIAGIVVPFSFGFGSVLLFPDLWGTHTEGHFLTFALFMGAALSITALPVIARILIDLELMRTELGAIIMAAAVVNDLLGWTLFAVILSQVAPQTLPTHSLWITLGSVLVFFTLLLLVGGWAARHLLPGVQRGLNRPGDFIGVTAIAVLTTAVVAEVIGVHAFFGAFMLGVALSQGQEEHREVNEVIHQFAASLLAPLYFVSVGLKADFAAHFDLPLVLFVLLVASCGKVIGASLAGRGSGMPMREALAVGFGMNARGAMEIILASIALEFGLIDQRLFVALVIMAVVTSMLSGPAMKWLLSPQRMPNAVEEP